jgi:hypothetical protein
VSTPTKIGLVILALGSLFAKLLHDLANAAAGGLEPNLANDVINHGWPFLSYAKDSLASGTVPLWNPYTSLGTPLFSEIGLGLFFPLAWIILIADVPQALMLIQFSTLLVGAAGMYVYSQYLSLDSIAKFLCVALYVYAVFTESFYPTMGYSFCMLPWVLWLGHRLIAQPDLRNICLLAIGTALCFFGGFPNYFIYTIIIVGVYCVCLLIFSTPSIGFSGVLARLGMASIAGVLALGLVAVQLLPSHELSGLSYRSMGSESAYDAGSFWEIFSIDLLLLNFLQTDHGYLFGNSQIKIPSGIFYLGGVLLFMPFAFISKQRLGTVIALTTALICLCLFVLSYQVPALSLIQKLPFAGAIRANGRAAGYIQFLFIVIACIGLSNLVEQGRGLVSAPSAVLNAVLWFLTTILFFWLGYLALGANDSPRFLVGFFACAALVASVLARPNRNFLNGTVWGLTLITVLDICSHREHRFLVPAFAADDSVIVASAKAAAVRDSDYHRVIFMETNQDKVGRLANLGPKYQIPSLDAYMGLTSARWENYVRYMIGPERFDKLILSTPLQRFYGYFSPGLLTAALHTPGLLETASLSGIYSGQKLSVTESPMPRAYTVGSYITTSSEEETLSAMQALGIPLTDTVVLEGASPGFAPAERPGHFAKVTIEEYQANKVTLLVEQNSPSILVLTDAFYPGWEARVDDREALIYRANSLFRAVEVPAGRHTVTFSYFPSSLYFGLGITLCSVLLLAALLIKVRARP